MTWHSGRKKLVVVVVVVVVAHLVVAFVVVVVIVIVVWLSNVDRRASVRRGVLEGRGSCRDTKNGK